MDYINLNPNVRVINNWGSGEGESRQQQLIPKLGFTVKMPNHGFEACACGDVSRMWTSWTQRNPARRFKSCPNYRLAVELRCNYFRWVDPELPNEWYKKKFVELNREKEQLEAKVADLKWNVMMLMCILVAVFVKLMLGK